MRKIILLIVFTIIAFVSHAQDLIILNKGNEIQAKVMEVNLSDIKYKRFDNLDGPSYTIQKDDVFMIKYQR